MSMNMDAMSCRECKSIQIGGRFPFVEFPALPPPVINYAYLPASCLPFRVWVARLKNERLLYMGMTLRVEM